MSKGSVRRVENIRAVWDRCPLGKAKGNGGIHDKEPVRKEKEIGHNYRPAKGSRTIAGSDKRRIKSD